MTIRQALEQAEHQRLDPRAAFSDRSRGRPVPEPEREDDVRTCYQRDTDRIVHSKAFRRLMHKTQVFLCPEGDHYRTRMTHTLEVARIARTITRALNLNEDLSEAIALGHDLGHTPFGHAGEDALSQVLGKPFRHNEQSLRVVDILEKDGQGLNLSHEVRLGILGHTGEYVPETLEGQIVRKSDQIAYINHDIDDACRAGILRVSDIPRELCEILGNTHSERISRMVSSVIENGAERIAMTGEIGEATTALRQFLFDRVYYNPAAKKEECKAKALLTSLFDYFCKYPAKMPEFYRNRIETDGTERCVCDYISGMTDRYAIDLYEELFIPKVWSGTSGT